jgi:5S rRNA maturation endonuclease (ribonuclease M5)
MSLGGMQASEQTENFLSRLDGVRKTGTGWVARCPCRNDDNNPSLSIGQGNDGRTLLTCHRAMSCNVEQICQSVGLRVSDLMPNSNVKRIYEKPAPTRSPAEKTSASIKIPNEKPKFVEAYDYVDENGVLLFQKVRYVDSFGKKTFRQRRPDGKGGWEYSLGDIPRILFNLPQILKAKAEKRVVWVVEGEKDANTLTDIGEVATTMPGGAGKWLDIHTEALAGSIVEIIADRDEVGIKHANDVYSKLAKAGCDVQAWICPNEKDITDHLASGGEIDELLPLDQPASTPGVDVQNGETIAEESPERVALGKLKELIERTDLTDKQKIAKSNLIIATSTVSFVLDSGRLVHWNDFLAETHGENYDWVIPGLLERSERVIVVAAEGVGKTMLARQVGILSAAGIHPFSFQPMKQIMTLTVDLENPERIIRRTSRSIAIQAMHMSKVERLNAYILTKPSGMDLLRASDRAILEEALDRVRPDMLVIGPVYKAFLDPGGRTSESVAIEVAKYLDTIRTIYRCALWIEHHAPLSQNSSTRDLRPFGSAVWSRWPEFGIALQPDPTVAGEYVYDVKHFRGARDERRWPSKMKRGKKFPFEVLDWMKVGDE